jgi:hypothetical protein
MWVESHMTGICKARSASTFNTCLLLDTHFNYHEPGPLDTMLLELTVLVAGAASETESDEAEDQGHHGKHAHHYHSNGPIRESS